MHCFIYISYIFCTIAITIFKESSLKYVNIKHITYNLDENEARFIQYLNIIPHAVNAETKFYLQIMAN